MQLHGSFAGANYTILPICHRSRNQFDNGKVSIFNHFFFFNNTGSSVTSTLPPIIDVPRETDNSGASYESKIRPSRDLSRAVNDFEATFFQSSRLSQSSQISCLADALSNSTSSSGKKMCDWNLIRLCDSLL